MAKNVAAPRPKSGNGTANPAAAAAEQPESLDQVRDILFGGQMRMVDARLQSLEERIVLEQTTLRNDLGRQISELENASKKEFAAHAERLSAERAKRADDLKALSERDERGAQEPRATPRQVRRGNVARRRRGARSTHEAQRRVLGGAGADVRTSDE